jgi:transcriptional regulator with XRE-family HTH domain
MARLRIKEIAEAKNIKQSQLQLDARVNPPVLNRYWNNKTSTIDLDIIEKIATALGVDVRELLESGSRPARQQK